MLWIDLRKRHNMSGYLTPAQLQQNGVPRYRLTCDATDVTDGYTFGNLVAGMHTVRRLADCDFNFNGVIDGGDYGSTITTSRRKARRRSGVATLRLVARVGQGHMPSSVTCLGELEPVSRAKRAARRPCELALLSAMPLQFLA